MPAQANPVPMILVFTAIGFMVGAVVVYFVMLNEGKKTAVSTESELLKERKNRFQEIAGLWRERAGGKFSVWLDEKMVSDSNILDKSQRERMESIGRELINWLDVDVPMAERQLEKPAAESAPAPLPPLSLPVAVVLPTVVPVPDRPLSIVEQVNDILKEIVAGTPMEARMIRLTEDPRQGVVVWVGSEHYNGVDQCRIPRSRRC